MVAASSPPQPEAPQPETPPPQPAPVSRYSFRTGTADNGHALIFGTTGSGKSFRVWEMARSANRPVLYVDPKGSIIGGIANVDGITWYEDTNLCVIDAKGFVSNPSEFVKLVDYLFAVYQKSRYSTRMIVIIDEAHLFTAGSDDVADDMAGALERLILMGREFFDVLLITQKPTQLRTRNTNVVFSQAAKIILFYCMDAEYDYIEERTGIPISPEIRAHLGGKYNYAVLSPAGAELYNGST